MPAVPLGGPEGRRYTLPTRRIKMRHEKRPGFSWRHVIQNQRRSLLRGVVGQDQASAIAASNFDCSLCLPAIKRERKWNRAVRLTRPLGCQPVGKVLQTGLGSIDSDAGPEAVHVRTRRNAQGV